MVVTEQEEVEADMMVLIVGLLEEVSESRTSRALAEAHLPKLTCHIEISHTDLQQGL